MSSEPPALPADLRRLVKGDDVAGLARALLARTPQERAALVPAFKALLRSDLVWSRSKALLVAGAATLPTAAQLTAWFTRRPLDTAPAPVETIMEVLTARGVPWLGELATRLAGAMRIRISHFKLTAALVEHTGVAVPTGDGFVWNWALATFHVFTPPSLERLRADPFLTTLLPRVFDVDGLGPVLGVHRWRERGESSAYEVTMRRLVELSAEGIVERGMLLDGVLGRLLRGDKQDALYPFVELHRQLDPRADEIAARVADYVRLLPDSRSFVATIAQECLRRLESAGGLAADALAEASEAVFSRREKSLVREQLSWLTAIARREPTRKAEIVALLAPAAEHADLTLAERARALAEKLGGAPTAATPALSGPAPPVAPRLWSPDEVEPITSVAELTAELAVASGEAGTPLTFERVLDGLARMWTLHPIELRAALAALTAAQSSSPPPDDHPTVWHLHHAVFRLTTELAPPLYPPRMGSGAGIGAVLRARVTELSARLPRQPVPFLLALPTSTAGHVAPAVLVRRMAEYERLGIEPWPYDLEQALLRLPREVDPDAVERARGLASPAGEAVARWLAVGGLADPPTRLSVDGARRRFLGRATPTTVLVEIGEAFAGAGLLTQAVLGKAPKRHSYGSYGDHTAWPLILPSHREVVAARLLPAIADAARFNGSSCPQLTFLVDGSGPAGPAVALALAYGLGAPPARASAIDALLALDIDLAPTGTEVGVLAVEGVIKLNRVVKVLADVAAAGHHAPVWTITAAALPPLLAVPAPPPGTPDLLQLAARAAATLDTRGEVPGVDEVAARAGSSRLVTEARRLQRVLAGGPL